MVSKAHGISLIIVILQSGDGITLNYDKNLWTCDMLQLNATMDGIHVMHPKFVIVLFLLFHNLMQPPRFKTWVPI